MSEATTDLDVLLIEDNDGDARLIEHHLSSPAAGTFVDDVTVTRTGTLSAGLTVLDDEGSDVVLLDLGLPESSGLDTLDRAIDADVSTPIIVLTGLDDGQISVEAIQAGAQDFLPKDALDTDRLVRALRHAVERHKSERELERRTEQMEFFNSILRHDILNGVNVITAHASMLAEDLDGEAADRAETIVDWSGDLTDLTKKIQRILATLTNDETRELHEQELAPIAHSQAERARSMSDEATVEVEVPSEVAVMADDLLEDVVGNLLTNAVEHAGPAVSAAIRARRDGATVTVVVADDGEPIPRAERDAVTDRGYKGSASSGTGFGLYFVNAIVESYGGSVSFRESDRGGTAVVLELVDAT